MLNRVPKILLASVLLSVSIYEHSPYTPIEQSDFKHKIFYISILNIEHNIEHMAIIIRRSKF